MIYCWLTYVLAVLADGRAVRGAINQHPNSWTDTGICDIMMTRVCLKGSMIAILTYTGELWIGTRAELVGISWDRRSICEDMAAIDDMAVGNQTVVIRAGDCIGIVNVGYREVTTAVRIFEGRKCRRPGFRVFDQAYELYGLCSEFIVAKTKDNGIQLLARRASGDSPLVFLEPAAISMESNCIIKDIICRPGLLIALMNDGTAHARSMHANTSLDWSFRQRSSTACDPIIKISNSGRYNTYITDSGHCYHTLCQDYSCIWNSEFKLVPCSDGLLVESVFMLADHNTDVIVHDGGKLSLLHWSYEHRGEPYRDWRWINWRKPMPFFDDKAVVDVVEIANRICITTGDGDVYWIHHLQRLINTDKPEPVRDLFFDANPLVTKAGDQRIRSAGSNLDDTDA